jgi:hypothetical protein
MYMGLKGMIGLALSAFLAAGACHNQSRFTPTAPPQAAPGDLLITLERTACYGFCPAYKLTISADGKVTFEGTRFVKEEGATKTSNLSPEQLKQLTAEFEGARFFSFEDKYVNDPRVCEHVVTDNPSAITSIRMSGKSKTVNHYYGCTGPKVPKELTQLENKIDEIVNTAQWLPDKKAQ